MEVASPSFTPLFPPLNMSLISSMRMHGRNTELLRVGNNGCCLPRLDSVIPSSEYITDSINLTRLYFVNRSIFEFIFTVSYTRLLSSFSFEFLLSSTYRQVSLFEFGASGLTVKHVIASLLIHHD